MLSSAQAERAGEPVDKTLAGSSRQCPETVAALRLSATARGRRIARARRGADGARRRRQARRILCRGICASRRFPAQRQRRADGRAPRRSCPRSISARSPSLVDTMWSRVKFASRNGAQVYAGQAADGGFAIILPSETRSLAEMMRAAALAAPGRSARQCAARWRCCGLATATAGAATNADAAAIERACRGVASTHRADRRDLMTRTGSAPQSLRSTPIRRSRAMCSNERRAARRSPTAPTRRSIALVETSYEPAEPGAKAQATSDGFALTRRAGASKRRRRRREARRRRRRRHAA